MSEPGLGLDRLGRGPAPPRERDVLRVAAEGPWEACDALRADALSWAERKTGQTLPQGPEAQRFDRLTAGQSVMADGVADGEVEVWALRVEDRDRKVAGRIWTTEVALGGRRDGPLRVTLRLLVNAALDDQGFVPAVPNLFAGERSRGALRIDGRPLLVCDHVETEEDADHFAAFAEQPGRSLPILALSQGGAASLDGLRLGRQLLGLAHVAEVTEAASRALTRRWGQRLSVFQGAARLYGPGFAITADPYAHRLILARRLDDRAGRDAVAREVAEAVAAASVVRHRLGADVLTFLDVRNAANRLRLRAAPTDRASEVEAARAQIASLEGLLAEARAENGYYVEEFGEERQRAETAEARLRGALARIAALDDASRARQASGDVPETAPDPATWPDLIEWIDRDLAGAVDLAPAARRSAKQPEFEDLGDVVAAFRWLAGPAREAFGGQGGEVSEARIADGVLNTHCGGDAFRFKHEGRYLTAEWHVKGGGNTRDPKRCLRIYWAFDPGTSRVIVAHLPSHRVTGAT